MDYSPREIDVLKRLCELYRCIYSETEDGEGVEVERDYSYEHHPPFPEAIVLDLWNAWRVVEQLLNDQQTS